MNSPVSVSVLNIAFVNRPPLIAVIDLQFNNDIVIYGFRLCKFPDGRVELQLPETRVKNRSLRPVRISRPLFDKLQNLARDVLTVLETKQSIPSESVQVIKAVEEEKKEQEDLNAHSQTEQRIKGNAETLLEAQEFSEEETNTFDSEKLASIDELIDELRQEGKFDEVF